MCGVCYSLNGSTVGQIALALQDDVAVSIAVVELLPRLACSDHAAGLLANHVLSDSSFIESSNSGQSKTRWAIPMLLRAAAVHRRDIGASADFIERVFVPPPTPLFWSGKYVDLSSDQQEACVTRFKSWEVSALNVIIRIRLRYFDIIVL